MAPSKIWVWDLSILGKSASRAIPCAVLKSDFECILMTGASALFIRVIFSHLLKGYPIPTRKSPLMLPEIGMLDRVLIARLAILPVKALMGRNDRLFGWKVENIQSIIHDILNDCRLAAVLHLSVPFRYLSNMFAGLMRPSHYSFRSGPGLDPWTLQIITTEMDTLLSAKMGSLCLSQRLKWPKVVGLISARNLRQFTGRLFRRPHQPADPQ